MMNIYVGNKKDNALYLPLEQVGNLLIGGTTGAGKSIYIERLIKELSDQFSSDDLGFALCDPKKVELWVFGNKPNVIGEISDGSTVEAQLDALIKEANKRLEKIKSSNKEITNKFKTIIFVCDEFADVADMNPQIIEKINCLAKISNKVSIYSVLASQRPYFYKNLDENNFSKCCMLLANERDSKEFIGSCIGTELKGCGDFVLKVGEALDEEIRQIEML